MAATSQQTYSIDVADVEYLRHGDKPLLARVYRPRGAGPFPLLLELHGGAWVRDNRMSDAVLNEPLSQAGIVVAALDYRLPPEAPYPAALADINYAIRWFKDHAADFGSHRDRVGVLGCSSGGHLGMLAAMRPNDPRYAAIPSPAGSTADARLRCAVLCWPVIDPLGRYWYVKSLKESGSAYPEVVDRVLPAHGLFWQSEANMAEGSPVRALERGEPADLPPVLYIQGTGDIAHPRSDLERFVNAYRRAGGEVALDLYDGEHASFLTYAPGAPASIARGRAAIIDFVKSRLA